MPQRIVVISRSTSLLVVVLSKVRLSVASLSSKTDLLAALREGRAALGEEPEGACDDLTEDAAEAEDAQSAPRSSAGRGERRAWQPRRQPRR